MVVRSATSMMKIKSLGGGRREQSLSTLLQLHSEAPFCIFDGERTQLAYTKRKIGRKNHIIDDYEKTENMFCKTEKR